MSHPPTPAHAQAQQENGNLFGSLKLVPAIGRLFNWNQGFSTPQNTPVCQMTSGVTQRAESGPDIHLPPDAAVALWLNHLIEF